MCMQFLGNHYSPKRSYVFNQTSQFASPKTSFHKASEAKNKPSSTESKWGNKDWSDIQCWLNQYPNVTCVPRLPPQFIMLTYIFMLAWLGVTAFTSLPVFIYFNIWNICQNATVLEGTSLCLDPRQYGEDDHFFSLIQYLRLPPPSQIPTQTAGNLWHSCCPVSSSYPNSPSRCWIRKIEKKIWP